MNAKGWHKIPAVKKEIASTISPENAEYLFAIPLDINPKHTYAHPCGTHTQPKICLPPHLAIKDVILHEMGHIKCRQAASGDKPYPDGWNKTFQEIAGYPYVGAGNDMKAEGCAEAVKQSLEKQSAPEVARGRRTAGIGEISQFINRPQAKGFKINIAETSKGGQWQFIGSIPTELVEPGTSRSLLFSSREEAVQAAKQAGYEEGKIYSKETGKEICVISKTEANASELESPLIEAMPAPFGWVGGKRQLSKTIVALIPPHKTYVEPFAGAASVFWKKEPSEIEVLNDKDADLIRFYRSLSELKGCDLPIKAHNWDKLKEAQGHQSPCQFLANVHCSFGSERGNFAPALTRCMNNAPSFHARLPEYQKRIKGVKLHNENWEAVVHRYDSPKTVFYFDPPYHGTSRAYAHSEDQLSRLAATLPKLKAKWLLTYDDHPDVHSAFKGFHMQPVTSRYIINNRASNVHQGRQLIIANYPLKPPPKESNPNIYHPPSQAEKEEIVKVVTKTREAMTPAPSDMLRWQYQEIIWELGELQRHGSDPNCPCMLADSGEYCLPKHALSLHGLARETIPMDSVEAHKDMLAQLQEEALDFHVKLKDRIVCDKAHKDEEDVAEWARAWRKKLETIYYTCSIEAAPNMQLEKGEKGAKMIEEAAKQKRVFCFETKKGEIVKPPYGLIVPNDKGVDTYWFLHKQSPNVPNCGVYDQVPADSFIYRSKKAKGVKGTTTELICPIEGKKFKDYLSATIHWGKYHADIGPIAPPPSFWTPEGAFYFRRGRFPTAEEKLRIPMAETANPEGGEMEGQPVPQHICLSKRNWAKLEDLIAEAPMPGVNKTTIMEHLWSSGEPANNPRRPWSEVHAEARSICRAAKVKHCPATLSKEEQALPKAELTAHLQNLSRCYGKLKPKEKAGEIKSAWAVCRASVRPI